MGRLRKGRYRSNNEERQDVITNEEVQEPLRGSDASDSMPNRAVIETPHGTSIHYRFSSMMGTNFISNTLTRVFLANTSKDMFETLFEPDVMIFMAFVISTGVFIAVGCLFGFHLALVRSGQTTIEYYEAWTIKYKLNKAGRVHKNEYDRGLNKNIESVLGTLPWYIAILPSIRKPPPLIVPNESPILFAWQQNLLRDQSTR